LHQGIEHRLETTGTNDTPTTFAQQQCIRKQALEINLQLENEATPKPVQTGLEFAITGTEEWLSFVTHRSFAQGLIQKSGDS
jgi:hypothetical protein